MGYFFRYEDKTNKKGAGGKMTNLEQQILDWRKVKSECDIAKAEPNKELRKAHMENFYAGIKMYYEKYQTQFNYWSEPK